MAELNPCRFRLELLPGIYQCGNSTCLPDFTDSPITSEVCAICENHWSFEDRECDPPNPKTYEPPIIPPNATQNNPTRSTSNGLLATDPGNLLFDSIRAVGLTPSSGCQCNQRIAQMQAWGWRGCWDNRNRIAGWLAEESAKIGIPVEPTPQAVFAKGMELVKEKGVEIPAHVFEAIGKVIEDDPELAQLVRSELEAWDHSSSPAPAPASTANPAAARS
jgi:hypothetical protein